jgi:flagellar biosynthesis anti-sigma factor FlgM
VKIDPQISLPKDQLSGRVGGAESVPNAKSPKIANDSSTHRSDQASLSSDAVQLSSLRARLNSVPEIRQDRVDSISTALNNGTYSVSNLQIAQSVLRDFQASSPSSR